MIEKEWLGRAGLYMEIIEQLSHRELIEFTKTICLLRENMDTFVVGCCLDVIRGNMTDIFAVLLLHDEKRIKCYTKTVYDKSSDHKPFNFVDPKSFTLLTMSDTIPRVHQVQDVVYKTYEFINLSSKELSDFLLRYKSSENTKVG